MPIIEMLIDVVARNKLPSLLDGYNKIFIVENDISKNYVSRPEGIRNIKNWWGYLSKSYCPLCLYFTILYENLTILS